MANFLDDELKPVPRTIPVNTKVTHWGRPGILLGHHPNWDYYEFLQEHLPLSDYNPSWHPKAQFKITEHEKTNITFSDASDFE